MTLKGVENDIKQLPSLHKCLFLQVFILFSVVISLLLQILAVIMFKGTVDSRLTNLNEFLSMDLDMERKVEEKDFL